MLIRDDTIAALSTAMGRAAIAVIRISGREAYTVAEQLVTPWPSQARQVTLCTIRDPVDSSTIDNALVTRFDAPRSYTGEPMVELACHGGVAVTTAVLKAVMRLGARQAEPGEFTQRAVLNGKMDLLQAEAVADLVDARTDALRRVSLRQLDGGLSRTLAELRERMLQIEALLTYDIDFPEEDDGPVARDRVAAAVDGAGRHLHQLLATAPLGEVARDGALVVIAGPPNAGKSSLFNALLGETRAIVTEVPGTTRDAIEARVESNGWPLRLVDTAGLRHAADVVEKLGIEVSEQHVRGAHVVLVCADSDEDLTTALHRVKVLNPDVPRIPVRTKGDRIRGDGDRGPVQPEPTGALHATTAESTGTPNATGSETEPVVVSATKRTGLDVLLRVVEQVLERQVGTLTLDVPIVARARHRIALESAAMELELFRRAWEDGRVPVSVAAVHVRSAVHALDELVGNVDVEEVLDVVFRTFCIGK